MFMVNEMSMNVESKCKELLFVGKIATNLKNNGSFEMKGWLLFADSRL